MKTAPSACLVLVLVLISDIAGNRECVNTTIRIPRNKIFSEVTVRHTGYDIVKKKAYFKIPSNIGCAREPYCKVEPHPSFRFKGVIDFFCLPNDPRFCPMYDKKGNIVGAVISILKCDVANVPAEVFNYSSIPDLVETNFFHIPSYSVLVYFTHPEKLTKEGRCNTCVVAEGVWTYLEGKLVELDRSQPIGPVMGDFDLQGCYPRIGNYFILNFNRCKSCNNLHIFAQYAQGWLVGVGLGIPGTGSPGPTRDWYEIPAGKALNYVIPNAPCCAFDILKLYNYTTVHVFLVDNPQGITCDRCDCDY